MGDWTIDVSAEGDAVAPVELRELEAVSRWVLAQEDARDGELSIALVTDATIAALNEQYLAHPGPTDVISFPLEDPVRLVGDIYVGLDQARRQATELDVPPREELLRLVVHGTLHVIGWDHPEGESSPMFERQEALLRSFLEGN